MQERLSTIFVADDQRDVLETLRLLLKREGFAAEMFAHPDALIEAVRSRFADVILMDLNYTQDTTSGQEGLEAIARLRALDATTPIVVMTAWGTIPLAVEALRRGAQDFIEKPWDNERLLTVLRTQVALGRAQMRTRSLEAENRRFTGAEQELIAGSPAMRQVIETVQCIAPSDANVLISGESGSGKGVFARLIHAQSPRRDRSLVTVNIGSLAESVFESELFGHVKGAFTDAKSDRIGRFELAEGGTLFLDEIANIPLTQQARLLRVLEAGEFERLGSSRTLKVDARVIAATNADIPAEIAAGRFRKDLYYRLNTIHIHLPPLRERGDDILRLAHLFLARHAKHNRRPVTGFTEAARAAMLSSKWPGNVRELSHVIERAVLMARAPIIGRADLDPWPLPAAAPGHAQAASGTLEEIERKAIEAALSRHDGNAAVAAEELGLSRSALYRRMEKFGL